MRALLLTLICLSLGGTARAGDDTLFRELGGQAGIERLMADFVQRLHDDPRIASFFKDSNLRYLQAQLSQQICQIAGGPCRYDGPDMRTVHGEMGVSKRDFNALVEDLQLAMDAAGTPFSVQNRLLARLAPLHREIIARP